MKSPYICLTVHGLVRLVCSCKSLLTLSQMTEFSPFCACVYACVFIYAIVFSHSSVDRFLVLMGIQENVNLEWTSRHTSWCSCEGVSPDINP